MPGWIRRPSALGLVLPLLLAACVAPPPGTPSTEQAVAIFDQLAFRHAGRDPEMLIKWTAQVRLRVKEPHTPAQRRAAERAFRAIRRASGHDMRLTSPGEPFNMAIHFLPRPAWPAGIAPPGWTCVAAVRRNDVGVIVEANVFVDPGVPGGEMCLEHELVHAMGLRGHATESHWTVMTEVLEDTKLRPLDRRLLAILYDPALEPGMRSEAVLPIVSRLVGRKSVREPGSGPITR